MGFLLFIEWYVSLRTVKLKIDRGYLAVIGLSASEAVKASHIYLMQYCDFLINLLCTKCVINKKKL